MLSLLLALALQLPHAPLSPAFAASAAPAPAGAAAADPLRGDWAKPSGKRVTLALSLTVDEALARISDAAGWNVIMNTGSAGDRTVSLKLRDVPAEEALRAALTSAGLVATRTGNVVVISEQAPGDGGARPVLSGFGEATGRRFTGEFDGEDAGDALKQIAASAGLSIVLPPGELEGAIQGTFRDVPVEDALRAVLAQSGLTAERQGELVVVQRAAPSGLLPELGREAQRTAEEAMRRAQRAMREAAERHPAAEQRRADPGQDREAVGSDLIVRAGEHVRNVSVVKGDLTIQGGGSARDAAAVMGTLSLESGASAHDVAAVLGSVRLAGGASAREVVAVLGDVEIGPGATVERDVVSVGGRVRVDPSARVGGSTHSIGFPPLPEWPRISFRLIPEVPSPLAMVIGTLVRFAVLFVLGLVLLAVMPRRLETVSAALAAAPVRSAVVGLLGSFGMLILTILLAATVVGLLLVPFQLLAMVFGGILGTVALTYHLGRLLPLASTRRTMVLQLAFGTLIFSVLAQIPVLGCMVWMATWLLAFGAVLRTRYGQPAGAMDTVELRAEVRKE